ncbi:MAG: hypothetical protein WAK33_12455 [Silvibacterium sp.]
MKAWPVDQRINNVKNNYPELGEPFNGYTVPKRDWGKAIIFTRRFGDLKCPARIALRLIVKG